MTDLYLSDEAVRVKYGLTSGSTFGNTFSKVSVESILFYVVAFGIWVLEKIVDRHKEEVSAALAAQTAHTVAWYRNKVLGFVWRDDTPVKYCSVDDRGCRLKIKIAGGEAGSRSVVDSDAAAALESYLAQEKDAGMKIEIVNENQNLLAVTLTVWYDPLELVPTERPVEAMLKAYVGGLTFDGTLSQNALVDAVQGIAGVRMVHVTEILTKYADNDWQAFGLQRRAESGYWQLRDTELSVTYRRYTGEDVL